MSYGVEYVEATAARAAQATATVATESERVFEWRRDCLSASGYGERLAFKLALDTDVDLHAAIELVDRGCDPDTAARILL